ncbi:MAG: glycoside hydrolase family 31 protein [bacterium]|nr:glycoside hydrolase family 31 protein [bacterium]
MQAISVLAGVYAGNVCRVCIHPGDIEQFPESPLPDPAARFERMPAHRDAQGMIQCKRKGLKLLYDPPTGNFTLLEAKGEILRGELQTGKFGPAEIQIRTDGDDRIYGFGAANGAPDRNDANFRLINYDTLFYTIPRASYSSVPFFILKRASGYVGVLWNSSLPADVATPGHSQKHKNATPGDDARQDGIRIVPDSGAEPVAIDLLIFTGTPAEILERFTELCGRAYVPPVWSLGFHQSRWSYRTAERVLQLARDFRHHDVPCDAIHIDIHYMERYRVFTWNEKRFPDPKGMHQALQRLGIRTVLFNDPGVSTEDYAVYRDGLEKNVFCQKAGGGVYVGKAWPGASAFPDFGREDVRSWWAEQHRILLEAGVAGICNDMNDPVLQIGKKYDPLKENILHKNGSHRLERNRYANDEAQATVEAFEKITPDRRPFIISRSGSTGLQKYSALWTGDNHSTWAHLRENLHMVLNLGLSGMSFTGADVGGFASGFFPGTLKVFKLRKQRELFARWLELGSLMPFFRAHTALYSFDQEPWSFGEEVLNIARKHIRRRYRLLPYLYSLFWESHETGAPIVRPLFYQYPGLGATELEATTDQFLLGPDLLAAPILRQGQKMRSVYLPEGEWYDFETGRRYAGGESHEFETRPGSYPLFVRAGAILPVCPCELNAETSLRAGLALEIYPGKAAPLQGRLRLDDGNNNAAFRGQYLEQSYTGSIDRSGNIQFQIETLHKKYSPPFTNVSVRLPAGYRSMSFREKSIEGKALDLMQEDRMHSVSTFELPLGTTNATINAEFEFRSNWS